MVKIFSKFVLFRVLGWKIINNFPQDLNKFVVIAAPHTSWVDFPIGVLVKYATGENINYIGKASLFKGPFGFIFKATGGTPVDRSKSNNLVEAIIDIFNNKEEFKLALSPEGTRKKTERWKTGFYYIAKGAKVPIVMATLDFGKKQVKISEPYYTTDNKDKDFDNFYTFFEGVQGKKPDQF